MTKIPGTMQVLAVAAAGILAAAPSAGQEGTASLTEAVTGGDTHLAFRYRYEFVDQDFNRATLEPFTKNAHASTLRVRLNYGTGDWNGWSAFGEFDYVGEILLKDFNSGAGTSPGREQYPVVADPRGANLNQLYVDYGGFSDTVLRFGRRTIALDNVRFIGGVEWRQNEQSYDSISGTFKGLPNTEVFYSYVATVNRIFGERSPAGEDHGDTHLLNVNIGLPEDWTLVPYLYHIDSDDTPVTSTSTIGASLNGGFPVGEGKLGIRGEFATQSDAGNNPVSYRANYWHFKLDWAMKSGLSLGLGVESLAGDQNVSGAQFRTPLATLHAFQGWADQFLATPNAGVDDIYASVKYKFGAWNAALIYHDFAAQSGNADWGSEFDISVGRKISDRYGVLFKGAFFSADDPGFSDVTKFWIMLTANY